MNFAEQMIVRLSLSVLTALTSANSWATPSQWQRPNGKIDHEYEVIDIKNRIYFLDTGVHGLNIVYDCWDRAYDVVFQVREENSDAPGTTVTTQIFYSYKTIDEVTNALVSNPNVGFAFKNAHLEPKLKTFTEQKIAPTSQQLTDEGYKIDVLEKSGKLQYLFCNKDREVKSFDNLQFVPALNKNTTETLESMRELYDAISDSTFEKNSIDQILRTLVKSNQVPFVESIANLLSQKTYPEWPEELKNTVSKIIKSRIGPNQINNQSNHKTVISLIRAMITTSSPPKEYWEIIETVFDHYYSVITENTFSDGQIYEYRKFVSQVALFNSEPPDFLYKKFLTFLLSDNHDAKEAGIRILTVFNNWPESLFDLATKESDEGGPIRLLDLASTRSEWTKTIETFVLNQIKNRSESISAHAVTVLSNKKIWNETIWIEMTSLMKTREFGKTSILRDALIRSMILRTEIPPEYSNIHKVWITKEASNNERDSFRQMGRLAIDPILNITPEWAKKTVCTELPYKIQTFRKSTDSNRRLKSLDFPIQIMAELFFENKKDVCPLSSGSSQSNILEKLLDSEENSSDPFSPEWKDTLSILLEKVPGQIEDVDILYSRIFYARILVNYLNKFVDSEKNKFKERASNHLIRLMHSLIDASSDHLTSGRGSNGILGSNIQMYAQALIFSTLTDMAQTLDYTSSHLQSYRDARRKLLTLYRVVSDSFFRILTVEKPGNWGLDYDSIKTTFRMHSTIGIQESRARTASWLAVLRRASSYFEPRISTEKMALLDVHFEAAITAFVQDRYLLLHIFNESYVPHDESEMGTGSHYLFPNLMLITKEIIQSDLKNSKKVDLEKLWNIFYLTYDQKTHSFPSNKWWDWWDVTKKMNTLMAGISLIDYVQSER